MGLPDFTDEQIQEREEESFQDRVFNDGVLLDWHRGHKSSQELIDRLAYLKHKADDTTSEDMADLRKS